jgi:hypothetical protein
MLKGDVTSKLRRNRSLLFAILLVVLVSASPLLGQVVIAVAEDVDVRDAVHDRERGIVWFATSEGLLYHSGGEGLVPRPFDGGGATHELYCIAKSKYIVWLGGPDGLFRVTTNGYDRVQLDVVKNNSDDGGRKPYLTVQRLVPFPNETDAIWMWVGRLVYRTDGNESRLEHLYPQRGEGDVPIEKSYSVTFLKEVDGKVFLGTSENLYVFVTEDGKFRAVGSVAAPNVTDVVVAQRNYDSNERIVYTVRESLGVNAGRRQLYSLGALGIELISENVIAMGVIEKVLWYSTRDTVYAVVDGVSKIMTVPSELRSVKIISQLGGFHWFASSEGIFRRDEPENPLMPIALYSGDFFCERLLKSEDNVWFFGNGRAFQIHENVRISVRLNARNFAGWRWVLSGRVRPKRVNYVENGLDPFPNKEWDPKFEIYLESEAEAFERNKHEVREYEPLKKAEYRPPSIVSDISVGVRDRFGSVYIAPVQENVLLAPRLVFQILLFYLGLLVALSLSLVLSSVRILPSGGRFFFYMWTIRIVKAYPIAMLFSPSAKWMRRLLKRIYRERYCRLQVPLYAMAFRRMNISGPISRLFCWSSRRMIRLQRAIIGVSLLDGQEEGNMAADILGEAERSVDRRYEIPASKSISVDELFQAVACQKKGPFANLLPVVVDCKDLDDVGVAEKIQNSIAARLYREIDYASKRFCEILAAKGQFVFIVSLDLERARIVDGVNQFFSARRSDYLPEYLILIAVEGTKRPRNRVHRHL